jgi:hypothetical protein
MSKHHQTVLVVRTARKNHECLICRGLISKGDYYSYATHFSHDPIMQGPFCVECIEIKL